MATGKSGRGKRRKTISIDPAREPSLDEVLSRVRPDEEPGLIRTLANQAAFRTLEIESGISGGSTSPPETKEAPKGTTFNLSGAID